MSIIYILIGKTSNVITPIWVGVGLVRKHIECKCLTNLYLSVHHGGRHNCFGHSAPIIYGSIENAVRIYLSSGRYVNKSFTMVSRVVD